MYFVKSKLNIIHKVIDDVLFSVPNLNIGFSINKRTFFQYVTDYFGHISSFITNSRFLCVVCSCKLAGAALC